MNFKKLTEIISTKKYTTPPGVFSGVIRVFRVFRRTEYSVEYSWIP